MSFKLEQPGFKPQSSTFEVQVLCLESDRYAKAILDFSILSEAQIDFRLIIGSNKFLIPSTSIRKIYAFIASDPEISSDR